MACELHGGTPQTDALPTPADWAKIYLEQLSEKNLRIAELEAIAREIIKAHRDVETGLEVPKYIYRMAVAAIER
jgi:predicted PilT family ATPase